MPALILEGGTFRPVFSCGVMDALLDHGLHFNYVIGVSAGITYATSYLSRQRGRNLEVLQRFRNDKRYMGTRNFVRNRSPFGMDFVFDTIPNRLVPFDWNTFYQYQGKMLVGVTRASTGKAEYLDGKQLDHACTMLRATCALPLVLPPVKIDNKTYFDGGIADPIPIRKSIADGNTKHLIVLTRPDGYIKHLNSRDRLAIRHFQRRWPNLCYTMQHRSGFYNETVSLCYALQREHPHDVIVLQPKVKLASFERKVHRLQDAWQMGYQMACERIDDIRALFD